MIRCDSLHLFYHNNQVLSDINVTIEPGEFVAVIGPPESGKTALIRILSGAVKPTHGKCVSSDGIYTAATYPSRPGNIDESLSDYLAGSRLTSGNIFSRMTDADHDLIEKVKDLFQLRPFENHQIRILSRSILTRARLAYALALPAPILCLDSPADCLDIQSQNLLARSLLWKLSGGLSAAVMATHNLNFALQYADRLLLLSQGKISMDVRPEEITGKILSDLFGVEIMMSKNIYNGRPEVHVFPNY